MGRNKGEVVDLCKRYIHEYDIPKSEIHECFGILERTQQFKHEGKNDILEEQECAAGLIPIKAFLFSRNIARDIAEADTSTLSRGGKHNVGSFAYSIPPK